MPTTHCKCGNLMEVQPVQTQAGIVMFGLCVKCDYPKCRNCNAPLAPLGNRRCKNCGTAN